MSRPHVESTRRPASARAPRVVLGVLSVALVACIPLAPARATERLLLAWDDCRVGSGTADAVQDCGALLSHRELVCSFESPVPIDSVIGAELVLDLQSAVAPLPAFWQLGLEGCNEAGLSVVSTVSGACPDAWGGFGAGSVLDALPGQPRGASSQIRLVVVMTVPAVQARAFDAGVVIDAARLDIDLERMGRCPGCQIPACLVLNSIRLIRLPGASDVSLAADPGSSENRATWQGGAGADCLAVPAARSSWGRLKVTYR